MSVAMYFQVPSFFSSATSWQVMEIIKETAYDCLYYKVSLDGKAGLEF